MMTTAKPRTTSSEASVRSLERMSMAAVPCLPLQGAWLLESPAFQSTEPAVVRAAFLMLERAWSATPAGTLPANPTVLAPMLGLTEHQLATNFEALSAGWTLADGRFVHEGMYALANPHKDKVKLTFHHGAHLPDPKKLFNAGLDGNQWRAIDFREGDKIDKTALKALLREAVAYNTTHSVPKSKGSRA